MKIQFFLCIYSYKNLFFQFCLLLSQFILYLKFLTISCLINQPILENNSSEGSLMVGTYINLMPSSCR